MNLFESFKNFYKRNKNRPFIGKILITLKNFAYRHKKFTPFLFFKQDMDEAKNVLLKFFPKDKVLFFLNEALNDGIFLKKFSFGHSGDFDIALLYLLTRLLKPEIVVETGVASGRSTAVILEAMKRNNQGHLYSIDLPKYYLKGKPDTYFTAEGKEEFCGYIPAGKQPGWLVPQRLRDRWTLILGPSKVELPKLVQKLEKIDIFFHDSEHSYENMKFEYETVWPKIPKGGFLLSDDVTWNNAFKEFLIKVNPKFHHTYRNLGIILK